MTGQLPSWRVDFISWVGLATSELSIYGIVESADAREINWRAVRVNGDVCAHEA